MDLVVVLGSCTSSVIADRCYLQPCHRFNRLLAPTPLLTPHNGVTMILVGAPE